MSQSIPLPHPDTGTEFGPPGFLSAADQREIRHQLRGIAVVELRQIGGSPMVAREVIGWLQAEGFEVQFRALAQMTPPPLRRIAFRFQGARAVLTLAPELG